MSSLFGFWRCWKSTESPRKDPSPTAPKTREFAFARARIREREFAETPRTSGAWTTASATAARPGLRRLRAANRLDFSHVFGSPLVGIVFVSVLFLGLVLKGTPYVFGVGTFFGLGFKGKMREPKRHQPCFGLPILRHSQSWNAIFPEDHLSVRQWQSTQEVRPSLCCSTGKPKES